MNKILLSIAFVTSWPMIVYCEAMDRLAYSQDDSKMSGKQEATEQETTLSKNFGKTHFIVGSSCQEVQEVLEQEGIAPAPESPEAPSAPASNDKAYFSPDDGLEKILLELISQEKTSIKIAVFLFTNGDIAHALIKAKEQGIAIEIITDQSCLQDRFNKIKMLRKAGIPIYVYKPDEGGSLFGNRMHHKFIIFGKNKDNEQILWFGSFNLTKTADRSNQEAVVVSKNSLLINQFLAQFDKLKDRSVCYKKKKCAPETKEPLPVVAKNFRTPVKRAIRKAKRIVKEIIT